MNELIIHGLGSSIILKSLIGPLFYLGPETIMPLASILAAVLGFILIFWRLILKSAKKLLGRNDPTVQISEYVEPDDDVEGKSNDA